MESKKLRVGFIGLGLMGRRMADNIRKKKFPLVVYNRTPSKAQLLEKRSVKVAQTPAELAAQVDVVITMVTASQNVEEVLFGENGVVYGGKEGLIVIDMSTIGPTGAKRIGEKLSVYQMQFVDAPVTGSTPKAETGELTIFVGGEQKVYKKVEKILSAMGTNIHYVGPIGSGQAIKLINNHLIAVSIVSLAEGMLLADAMGISRKKTAEILQTVPAMSGMMNLKLPNFVTNSFPLLFSLANMNKDLILALEEAEQGNKTLPLLENTVKLYRKAVRLNLAEEDMSAIIKIVEKGNSNY